MLTAYYIPLDIFTSTSSLHRKAAFPKKKSVLRKMFSSRSESIKRCGPLKCVDLKN